MGVRTYEMVVERRVLIKGCGNKTCVRAKIDSGEIPVYEDEVIVSLKEKLPKQETLPAAPVYTPKSVFKRGKKESTKLVKDVKEEESVDKGTMPVEVATEVGIVESPVSPSEEDVEELEDVELPTVQQAKVILFPTLY